MEISKIPLLKFIAISAGLHLMIGGLLFLLPLNLFQASPAASVMQVSLVNAVETAPAATQSPKTVEPSLQPPSDMPVHYTDGTKETDEAVVQPSLTESEPHSVAASPREPRPGDGSNPEELNRFLQDVRTRLERAKQYPWTARLRGQEGTVRIQFMIAPSGEVKNIHLMESSGAKTLDDEAIATLERVGRFSEPPVSWNAGLPIQVPLVFQLNSP